MNLSLILRAHSAVSDSVVWIQSVVLTHLHQSVTGHGVPRKGQFPAGSVREAAGEGVLTVTHQTRLDLRHTKQNDE